MSNKNFRAAGVPWFASPALPAIRPRTLPMLSQEKLDAKAKKMQATHYVRAAVRAKFKEGDKFYITPEPQTKYDFYSRMNVTRQFTHAGQTGTYIEIKLQGSTYFVIVKWDDPDYKPIGLYNKISVYDLYHFGFTWDEAAVAIQGANDDSGILPT